MTTEIIDRDYHTSLHKESQTPYDSHMLKYASPVKITPDNAESIVAKCIQISAQSGEKPVLLTDPHNEVVKLITAPENIEQTAKYHARVTEEIKDTLAGKIRPDGKGTDATVTSPEKAKAIHI